MPYLRGGCKLKVEFDWDFQCLPLRATALRRFKESEEKQSRKRRINSLGPTYVYSIQYFILRVRPTQRQFIHISLVSATLLDNMGTLLLQTNL